MELGSGGFAMGGAARRESQLIATYHGRIAGFEAIPGMSFVGLAWASSTEPGMPMDVRYIDALYRRRAARSGYADVAVRTWLRAPLAREQFSADPYLATHLRDFMMERSSGEFDFEFGIDEIVEALHRPGRRAGELRSGEFVAARYPLSDVVTLAGYAISIVDLPNLTRGLGIIPRLRA
jgi:hypothetical protein